MDAEVARPYGLEVEQKERDRSYVQSLSVQVLEELSGALNVFHGTHHGLRYWEIVLGHWLQRYVATVFNRYFTLEQALREYDVSGTAFFDSANYSLATNNTLNFVWACDNDIWNHVLCARILDFMGYARSGSDVIPLCDEIGFAQEKARPSPGTKRTFLRAANQIWHKFSRKRDAFIINSYLPLKEEVQLQLSLGQCPQSWRSPELESVEPDPGMRQRFHLGLEGHSGFERFVREQLGQILPTCYLEGYEQLTRQVESLPWPTTPQFIFTSNNFDTDDIFKVWAAQKAESGAPYFTGQHGNNYGTHFYLGNSSWPERAAASKFLSWGWADASSGTVPAFAFTIAGVKQGRFDPEGGLLMVEVCQYPRITPWDSYFEYGNYQEELPRFAGSLPHAIQKELVVRLHHGWRKFRWSDERRWKEYIPDVQIEAGVKPIRQLIARSRLVVHSYDSTGMLETLAMNIPTLCFWHGGLEHVLPEAKPYYMLLKEAGILADGPEHAAELVASYWNDIDRWWGGEKTQSARRKFCDRYARTEKHPVGVMKELLTTQTALG